MALHVRVIGRPLALGEFVENLREGLDLARVIYLSQIEIVLQGLRLRGVRALGQFRLIEVGLECPEDVLGVVDEVKHEGRVLAGNHAVQVRECLHRLHAVEPVHHATAEMLDEL
jgi:hypothetical protein